MAKPQKKVLPNGKIIWEVRIREGGRGSKEHKRRFDSRNEADDFLNSEQQEKRRRSRGYGSTGSFLDTSFEIEANNWLQDLEIRASKSWVRSCKKVLADFNQNYGHITPDKVTPAFLGQLQRDLKRRKGRTVETLWSNATVNRYTEAICAVLNYAAKQKRIPYNPLADFKKLPKSTTEMLFWSKEEASSFLTWASAKYFNPSIMDLENGRQYYLAYLVAINTGVRAGELWGLKPIDLMPSNEHEGASLHIRRQFGSVERDFKGLKSEQLSQSMKDRHVPCPIELERELQQHIKHNKIQGHQTIFQGTGGKPITHRTFSARFERDVTQWQGRKIRFHDLRHSASCFMLASGIDIKAVQQILGHEKLQTTERYLHVLGGRIRQVAKTHSVLPTPQASRPLHLVTNS